MHEYRVNESRVERKDGNIWRVRSVFHYFVLDMISRKEEFCLRFIFSETVEIHFIEHLVSLLFYTIMGYYSIFVTDGPLPTPYTTT